MYYDVRVDHNAYPITHRPARYFVCWRSPDSSEIHFSLICCSPEAARTASRAELWLFFGDRARAWGLATCEKVSNLGSEHVNDEDSERYILGQLPEPKIGRLEKHLDACKECRQLVKETEWYVHLMPEALGASSRSRVA